MNFKIEDILIMKYPSELYSNDKDLIKKEHKELLKKFHPDFNNNEEKYNNACTVINQLYAQGLKDIEEGNWYESGVINFIGKDNKKYSMKYKIDYPFELGQYYIGNNSILFLINEDKKKYLDNYLNVIKNFKYADDNMKKEFRRFLPKILSQVETKDNKICLVIEKTNDVYCLRDILNYYEGKVPPRHVVWILGTLYNLSSFLYFNNLSHNGININTYYISPLYHSGLLLGGWWYTIPIGNKMIGTTSEVYNVMPTKIKNEKVGSNLTDLESIRLIGRTLLGDSTGMSLHLNKEIPIPLLNWVKGIPNKDSFKEYENWDKVIDESYGERKFIEMKIDQNLIYKNI